MDFDLPEELKLLQQTIRDFVKRELIPLEGQVPEGEAVPEEIRTPIQEKIKEMGLWLIEVPEEYGGAGLSLLGKCIVWEEVGKTTAVPFRAIGDIFGPAARILVECNEQQREKYLFPLIRGEKKTSFALTEPEAGSDPASIQTRAVKRDSYYVINGAKRFITRGHEAHFFQVFAVTDPEKRARGGITCFLVDADLPGVELGSRYETMMGDRPSEIFFNDVKVPEENILGKLGEGFVLAQRWTTEGRLHQAARSLGTAQRCLDMAIEYANQRVTFGQPLARRQAVMFMIADSAMELHASRLIVYDCAWKHDQGREVRNETFMAKVYANEMASRVVDRAIQIHGSIGLTKELPLERWYRDVRSRRITEGASEVMRWTLARNLLRS